VVDFAHEGTEQNKAFLAVVSPSVFDYYPFTLNKLENRQNILEGNPVLLLVDSVLLIVPFEHDLV
jgi:hypothetical protein